MIKRVAIFCLLMACGSSPKPAPVGETKPADEHASMPPSLQKFHDLLAPRWHADKNLQRIKVTCDAMPQFTAGATEIATATPPPGANGWTEAAGKLAAALEDLDAACKANDTPKFETAFDAVHASFHGLLEAAGGEHHEEH